jgi:acetyltransferase
MDFFFNPSGIALIGASANPQKGGYHILKNLRLSYSDNIYAVNPAYSEIDGLKCYASVLEVPDPVDMAIVFVPAAFVPRVLRDCARRGIKGVMIQSAGFAEIGPAGEVIQQELSQICEETGIRLWGPNCMGMVDAVHARVFSFMLPQFMEEGLTPGGVSLIVQSGMLSAGFLIDIMTHGKMGISKACSIGNKIDVDECDVLEYLVDDPHTSSIGLYLESIPDGRRFSGLCRRSPKPIVVLQGGKSKKGAQAAMSHTASLAGDAAVVSGALAQAGVVEAYDFKQMMDVCRTLDRYPAVPPVNTGRLAILTMSGAAGIVSSDFIEQHGLAVAELSSKTREDLQQVFPDWMPVTNPIDLWPAVEVHGRKKAFGRAFEAVCADPDVDAILIHLFVFSSVPGANFLPLVEMADTVGKPLFCWVMGKRSEVHEFLLQAREMGMPAFDELHRTVECAAAVFCRNKALSKRD